MLEIKEKIKMEFDFLKSIFLILLAFFGGIIATLFTKDLGVLAIFVSIVGGIVLGLILFKIYQRITEIYKG